MLTRLLSLLLMMLSLGQSAVDGYVNEMNLGENLFLVNRRFTVSADYVPSDLTVPKVRGSGEHTRMRKEAAAALEELFAAAEKDGYTLYAVSGYRSYGQQRGIHQRRVAEIGKKEAMRVSAPPGASEHQLGLAMDLGCKGALHLTEKFGALPEGIWVAENCYRFGFIIRYKAEWEEITGYKYEPWHIRYVGKEHARRIRDMDLPFETYVSLLQEAKFALMTGEKEGSSSLSND